MVHLYPQGLEQLGHVLLLALLTEECAHCLHQVAGRDYGLLTPGLDNQGGHSPGLFQLAI